MRTIYYRVAVSAEKEQEFLNALAGLRLKETVKMCEKILHMLKARRYAYLENITCFGPVSSQYRRLMEIKISELTEIIEEIEKEQKQDDIIIA